MNHPKRARTIAPRGAPLARFPPCAGPVACLVACLALLAACASSAAGRRAGPVGPGEPGGGHRVPDRGYDVEHYAIELVLEPEQRAIAGLTRIRLAPTRDKLEVVELDLVGLTVESVQDDRGRELAFRRLGSTLRIHPVEPLAEGDYFEVSVRYRGTPRTGLWFSGRRADGSGPTQVFSQGQAEHNRGWFPCFDHLSDRATSEIRVTMPSTWIAVAPGERIDVAEGLTTRTEHWRMTTPHPTYLVSLVAGELIVEESQWDGIPLLVLAEERYRDWLEASFHETDEMLAFLSDYTGVRYPYSKYSQACVDSFPWGGMENISATTLTPLTLDDERGQRDAQSTALVVHEAAHQWFGDLFTCADWSHLWLNEGFATYMEFLYAEATRGVDEARALVRDALEDYLEEDEKEPRRATVSWAWREPEDLMDTRVYEGAAVRLHLLRFLVGDEAFRRGVRAYCAENAGRDVRTEDLRKAMEAASGEDLSRFFEQWIHGAGHPELVLGWEWNAGKEELRLEVRQVQSTLDGTPFAFEVPVDVEVVDDRGATTHRVQLTDRSHSFDLPAPHRPTYVVFDKYGWIPKEVRWQRTVPEWLALANGDDDVNGRRDALRALGQLARQASERGGQDTLETIVAELVSRLRRDESPYVRVEAARALGLAGSLEARERLIVAAKTDASAPVRVAALGALGEFGLNRRLADFARLVFEDAYSWATMGAAAQLACGADPGAAFGWLAEKLPLPSPHDQLRSSLLAALGGLEDERVDDELRRWAEDADSHPTARAAAIRQLAGRDEDWDQNGELFAAFLGEENFRLRQAAIEALAGRDDHLARALLRSYYPGARNSSERRAIEAALATGD